MGVFAHLTSCASLEFFGVYREWVAKHFKLGGVGARCFCNCALLIITSSWIFKTGGFSSNPLDFHFLFTTAAAPLFSSSFGVARDLRANLLPKKSDKIQY